MFIRGQHILQLIVAVGVAAVSVACAPTPNGPGTSEGITNGRILDMLEALRPSEAEVRQMAASKQDPVATTVAAAPGLAPAASAPQVVAFELQPYLIDGDNQRMPLDDSMSVTELVDGTLAVIPYDITYSDANTSFVGQLDIRFTWDGDANLFLEATPPYVLSLISPNPASSYVQGTIYNAFLDMIEGDVHDNGYLPDAEVYAVSDPVSGEMVSVNSAADGSFSIGPLRGDATYTVVAAHDGFYAQAATIYLAEGYTATGVDFDLVPQLSSITHTTQVYGTLRDLDGNPLDWQLVRLINADTGEPVDDVPNAFSNAQGEYMFNNVAVVDGVGYQVAARVGSMSAESTAVYPFGSTIPDTVRADVVLDNHAPAITCHTGGDSGSNVALTIAAGDVVDFSAVGFDADGDPLLFDWSHDSQGYLVDDPNGWNDHTQATYYSAPGVTGNETITVLVSDGAQDRTCSFDLTIVYGS